MSKSKRKLVPFITSDSSGVRVRMVPQVRMFEPVQNGDAWNEVLLALKIAEHQGLGKEEIEEALQKSQITLPEDLLTRMKAAKEIVVNKQGTYFLPCFCSGCHDFEEQPK